MINGIASIIAAGNHIALTEAFKLLEDRLCAYFAVEEHIAQAVNFDFTQHRLAHQSLLEKIKLKHNESLGKYHWTKPEQEYYIHSLKNYLFQHVREDSKPFKAVLETQFYYFNPSCAGGGAALHGIG